MAEHYINSPGRSGAGPLIPSAWKSHVEVVADPAGVPAGWTRAGFWLGCKEFANAGPKSMRSNPASLPLFPGGIMNTPSDHTSLVGVVHGKSPVVPVLFLSFVDGYRPSETAVLTTQLPQGEEAINLRSLLERGPAVVVFGSLTGSGTTDTGFSGIFAVHPKDLLPIQRGPDYDVTDAALRTAYVLTLN
jgi:hypothetical protein